MAFIERMAGQNYIDATRQYLDYLETHLSNVQRAFTEVSDACTGMAWVNDDCSWHSIRHDVMRHDLSKFSEHEFTHYRDHFFPVDGVTISPHAFRDASMRHKETNHHHHDSVENYQDLVHMIIDWTAMSYIMGGSAESYYGWVGRIIL